MDRRVWLLVEWVDENNVFASYGVVNVDTFSYKENELEPGKQIFIRLQRNEPRCAKIIRISDNKRQVKEHKEFLERQDKQVKNVLQLCMRTIKEMKSEQYTSSIETGLQMNVLGQQSSLPRVISALSENSESDTDTDELHIMKTQHIKMANYNSPTHHQNIRYETNDYRKIVAQNTTTSQRRRSIISSTPLPGNIISENTKLFFDQGTQTENTWFQPQVDKIDEIELVLKHLYGRFQSLVMRVNSANNATISESEQNGEVSYVEPNDSWTAPYNIPEHIGTANGVEDNHATIGDIETEPNTNTETQNFDVKIPVKMEAGRKTPNENARVRRMSAQTTYSNEMVAIGNGHAMIPARLINEIDWTSHTSATRQLLQAIFSRKVLATHSLTGKQSPAHLNKPAKKLLDPNLVDDIIITVSAKSGVPKNLVRNTITVKCTDEAKLYRNRQRYKYSRSEKNQQNDENIPPSLAHSSDDSSRVIS